MENGNSKDFMEGMVIGLLAGIPFTIFTLSVGSEIFQALGTRPQYGQGRNIYLLLCFDSALNSHHVKVAIPPCDFLVASAKAGTKRG